ncbi:MAG: hypothetical protein Q7S39_08390 [Ignavibacteria bacterium]|nr:hypothetical protein [Ignavibacteria bacterium]
MALRILLIRIEATVFKNNSPSKKVLEKTRFMLEGTLRKFYIKDYKFIDADILRQIEMIYNFSPL